MDHRNDELAELQRLNRPLALNLRGSPPATPAFPDCAAPAPISRDPENLGQRRFVATLRKVALCRRLRLEPVGSVTRRIRCCTYFGANIGSKIQRDTKLKSMDLVINEAVGLSRVKMRIGTPNNVVSKIMITDTAM